MSTSTTQFVEIYLAANPNQAHLLRVMLEQEAITARVMGDLLQNAAGELPLGAASAPSVWVSEQDAATAREIIDRWEAAQREEREPATDSSWACPACGELVSEGDTDCPVCGRRLDDLTEDTPDPDADGAPVDTNWRLSVAAAIAGLTFAATFIWWTVQSGLIRSLLDD